MPFKGLKDNNFNPLTILFGKFFFKYISMYETYFDYINSSFKLNMGL